MSINSIENITRYSDELDKMFEQKSAVGFFADNALATKFVGAKTVIVPDIEFDKHKLMMISPDEGGMGRSIYYDCKRGYSCNNSFRRTTFYTTCISKWKMPDYVPKRTNDNVGGI